MATAPLFSTVSAVTELLVTAAVYVFLVRAYRGTRFHGGLLAFALSYEVLVNVAYMTYRLFVPSVAEHSDGMSLLLAFHGILSLFMLVGLIGLAMNAWRGHRQGTNTLRAHPKTTWAFGILWAISILTGEAVYVLSYLV